MLFTNKNRKTLQNPTPPPLPPSLPPPFAAGSQQSNHVHMCLNASNHSVLQPQYLQRLFGLGGAHEQLLRRSPVPGGRDVRRLGAEHVGHGRWVVPLGDAARVRPGLLVDEHIDGLARLPGLQELLLGLLVVG